MVARTKTEEELPRHGFNMDPILRTQVTFILTSVLRGEVCSKVEVADELKEALDNIIENNEDSDVVVESYELVMTAFKTLK